MKRNSNLPLTETVYYILLTLWKPAHGYLIMQKIEELSEGQVKMAAGTLYGALDNLLKSKLIAPTVSEDKRRKTYVITKKGKELLEADFNRMIHMVKITEAIAKEVE
ncbi:PadR family transcriptional regulator [Marinilactibacillus sp. GCM10026970]|uniref:PadR family transcriptional regulator n=1 Tax=Marinilactibacillus sp. GCM10026970 TaxID=3252642 RepID=UPI00361982FE